MMARPRVMVQGNLGYICVIHIIRVGKLAPVGDGMYILVVVGYVKEIW
jgi:hypothetical protein